MGLSCVALTAGGKKFLAFLSGKRDSIRRGQEAVHIPRRSVPALSNSEKNIMNVPKSSPAHKPQKLNFGPRHAVYFNIKEVLESSRYQLASNQKDKVDNAL